MNQSLNTQQFRELAAFGDEMHRLLAAGAPAQAEADVRQMMARYPNEPALLLLLGHALRMQSKHDAMAQVGAALMQLRPECGDHMFLFGYAAALYQLGQVKLAMLYYMKVLQLAQALSQDQRALMADVLYGLGLCHDTLGESDKAARYYEMALNQHPGHTQTLFADAMLKLKQQGLATDAALPASRFLLRGQAAREGFTCPLWQGQSLAGKRLLLYGDQGVGDIIMFASMLPVVLAQAAQVALEVQPTLAPLLARSFPDVEVIAHSAQADARASQRAREDGFDLYAPMSELLSVVSSYRPADHASYLKADTARVQELRARYRGNASAQKLLGISWRTIQPDSSFRRSVPLALWGDVLRAEGFRVVSLQYSGGSEEIADAQCRLGVEMVCDELINPMRSHEDCAAQVAAMDAVVSIQNATVHMAGALGVPCCMLIGKTGDWRYGISGDDNPWYHSLYMVRQQAYGQWQDEILRAAQWLRTQR